MKLFTVLTLGLCAAVGSGHIVPVTAPPEPTKVPLEKRVKEVIVNPNWKKNEEAKTQRSSTQTQKPWIRTVSLTQVEIVTPTVIAGVTFGAKPPKTTDGLEPWISLNKDGSPKTIKPQLKNGNIKNPKPSYSTWFGSFTTVQYNKEQLKAHNMAEDEIFTEEIHIEEDKANYELNPLMRCTPDDYAKKGMAKYHTSEPFCYPRDNQKLILDKTYFITWYSGFFKDTEKVKLHLTYVKESAREKGLKKRDNLDKRSSVLEKGGTVDGASFYTSEWLPNTQGWVPVTIDEEWFGPKDYYRKVLISLQPDSIPEDEFDYMKNSIVVEISKGAKVGKETMVDLKKLEEKQKYNVDEIEDGIDTEKYMIMMTMPLVVAIAALLMYFFVVANRFDLSHLKKRKFARGNTTHKKIPFRRKNELPRFNNDIELTKTD